MHLAETVWAPGTHPQLDAAYEISKYDSQGPDPEKRWAAYLTDDRLQIVPSTRFREGDEGFSRLEEYLDRQDPSTLLDYLFVVDSYYQSRVLGEPLLTERSLDFTPDPILDELLSASDGILLWQFQFEQLAQLFVEQRPDAIELRRRINPDDLVAVKNVPSGDHFTIVRIVEGGYHFEISEETGDQGHILPVEKVGAYNKNAEVVPTPNELSDAVENRLTELKHNYRENVEVLYGEDFYMRLLELIADTDHTIEEV